MLEHRLRFATSRVAFLFTLSLAALAAAPAVRAADSTAIPDAAADGNGQLTTITITAQHLNEVRQEIETRTGASTYTITSDAIAATPGGENVQMNQVLLQAPGVVQDSFGQLHVRGAHGSQPARHKPEHLR